MQEGHTCPETQVFISFFLQFNLLYFLERTRNVNQQLRSRPCTCKYFSTHGRARALKYWHFLLKMVIFNFMQRMWFCINSVSSICHRWQLHRLTYGDVGGQSLRVIFVVTELGVLGFCTLSLHTRLTFTSCKRKSWTMWGLLETTTCCSGCLHFCLM